MTFTVKTRFPQKKGVFLSDVNMVSCTVLLNLRFGTIRMNLQLAR